MSAALGASRVAAVERRLAALGYRYVRASASGRSGQERAKDRIPCDIIAFGIGPYPHLVVEVGGAGKRVAVTLAEMQADPLPGGFVALVATCVKRRWRYYLDADNRFDDLAEALDAARDS